MHCRKGRVGPRAVGDRESGPHCQGGRGGKKTKGRVGFPPGFRVPLKKETDWTGFSGFFPLLPSCHVRFLAFFASLPPNTPLLTRPQLLSISFPFLFSSFCYLGLICWTCNQRPLSRLDGGCRNSPIIWIFVFIHLPKFSSLADTLYIQVVLFSL